MKKLQILVCLALCFIIIINLLYYKALYDRQINNLTDLLDRQVRISGKIINDIDNRFADDLKLAVSSSDISLLFLDKTIHSEIVENMKLFFTKYEDLITGIKYFDNNRNEFTLKKDETGKNWLEQQFVLHVQGEIITEERFVKGKRYSEYFLPVFQNNVPIGNLVIAVDLQQFFTGLFSAFNIADRQWQWVISDSGQILFNNSDGDFTEVGSIARKLDNNSAHGIIHHVRSGEKTVKIISSYLPAQLLNNRFGIIFSSATDYFQDYIVYGSIITGTLTFLLFLVALFFLWRYIKSQRERVNRLRASEEMLFRMIEEMPVGIIIHNRNGEIIKANKMAASQYSYADETIMKGKIFPEPTVTGENSYYSGNRGENFRPEQFVILKKEVGEMILFRNSIPVIFGGEEAILEMLLDITMLENARKNEVSANVAKSEFLARMSYELRTPLNGIIGMADILQRRNLTKDDSEIVSLLQRSAGVLLRIIDDILDFSKIETGRMIIEEIPFNLREEIIYCYDLARTGLNEENVKLSCSVSANIPERVIGDPFRLRQVITNFLNHSITNTSHGEIRLLCSLQERKDRMLTLGFEISDTGKNFDSATLKKIFGEYLTLGSKVIQNDEESGFGTILARQLIDLMGGDFSAESPSGIDGDHGTKIRFSITVYSQDKKQKSFSSDEIKSFESIKTLVITGSLSKDEEIIGLLHKLGLTLTVTTYQRSTVSQIEANLTYPGKRYSLIIILDDSNFDGFRVAEELQEKSLTEHFILILMSTNDKKGNLLRCLTMGIDHYIVKPFEIKELYDTIRESFSGIDTAVPSDFSDVTKTDLEILIVEDNKMNQKVLGTMLKSLGYSFDFADDGYSGYIQAKTRRYDVIFMDLIMPEMDGFESARKMIEYDPDLLIAAFTADNMPDSKRKAELSGIRDFISKPVRVDDLRKFFMKHFNNRKSTT